jgi:hypothetical protein
MAVTRWKLSGILVEASINPLNTDATGSRQGSFDYAAASLREAAPSLRMTLNDAQDRLSAKSNGASG